MEKEKFLEIAYKGVDLLKRMGENIDTESYNYLIFMENRKAPVLITEGLIESYDIDRVINLFKSLFDLKENEEDDFLSNLFKQNGKEIKHEYNGKISKKNNNTIKITLPNKNLNLKDNLDYYFKKYGYINSRVDNNSDNTTSYYYEKKYPEEINLFQILQQYDCLYHVTEEKNINNILKKGLKTKSNKISSGYMHDERNYFFLNYPDKEIVACLAIAKPKILKIDLNKLPLTYTFYFDQRLNNAVFSYEQIPPEVIEIIN